MHSEVDKKWREYMQTRNPRVRNQLALEYQGLVQYVARGFQHEGVSVLESDDLISAGNMGLLEAIERFDPTRKIKFETYAILRIRGAILDTLRNIDWIPRSTRKNIKQVMKAISDLQGKLKRNPSETEIAEKLGISIHDYGKILSSLASIRFVSLQDIVSFTGGGEASRKEFIEDTNNGYEEEIEDYNELKESIYEKIKGLPAKERLILILYYYEGLNLAEIAKVLNVTESRVCQLNSQALMRLKIGLRQEKVYV